MVRAPRRVSGCVVAVLIAAAAVASGASAADDEERPRQHDDETSSDERDAAAAKADESPAQAVGMGGPSSVGAQLVWDERKRKYEQLQKPKKWLQEKAALSIGADYNLLAQQVSESPGSSAGAGGALRFYGQWVLVGRGRTTDVGSLVYKVEHRHSIGTELPASAVLPTAGAAGISGPTFGDNGGVLTNLYWTQSLADNRFALVAGVVDTTDYMDVYGLVNVWTEFNNLAFSTSPAIAVPNQGLGAAVRFMVTPRWYVLGGSPTPTRTQTVRKTSFRASRTGSTSGMSSSAGSARGTAATRTTRTSSSGRSMIARRRASRVDGAQPSPGASSTGAGGCPSYAAVGRTAGGPWSTAR